MTDRYPAERRDRLHPRFRPARASALLLLIAPLVGPVPTAGAVDPPVPVRLPQAPPLPPPRGPVIEVADAEGLLRAVERAGPGTTILLADGHYRMPRYIELRADGVTLRGASGDRTKVVLDGGANRHGELLGIAACSGVTIADLTIRDVRWNGIKLNAHTGVQRVTVHNCVLRNVWQRGLKGTLPRDEATRPRDCRVEYCLFANDRPKRFADDPADTAETFGGDYVGGIDAMGAEGWTIRDNVFVGLHGRTGQGRGAIFLWNGSRGCIVERNIIVDSDAGICLGNSSRRAEIPVHCIGCVVRNNFVTRAPQAGLLADYTRDCLIAHNTVHDPASRLRRLIRVVHDNPGLVVANNLLSGPDARVESPCEFRLLGNLARDLTADLINPARGDLHLRRAVAGVIGRAVPLPEVQEDIDGQPRGLAPDVGADQLVR